MIKIFKSGYEFFYQEKTITFASLGTTIIVSFFVWAAILSFYFFNQMINYVQERLDFSIYFKNEITREEITKVQKIIQNFPQVKEVKLITQEEALERFKKEARTNPIISRALTEVNINPLVDYLIVKAESSEAYPKIANYLEKSPYKVYIDYITYSENQKVINKIISISTKVRALILLLIIFILFLSTLIIFNNILISIYSQKEMIEILRLIGANNWFIRGPFLVYSFLFTFLGYIISLASLILFLDKTDKFWQSLVSNFQPTIFIFSNFFTLNFSVFMIILFINWLGTILALENYLKK